ncbi:MAG: hypothetical protein ACYDBH_10960 [Acidobacteriaceae bacterium]
MNKTFLTIAVAVALASVGAPAFAQTVETGGINVGIDTVSGATVPTLGAALRINSTAGNLRIGLASGHADGYTLTRGEFRAESLPRIGFSPLRVGLMFAGGGVNLSGNGTGTGGLYALAGMAFRWRIAPGSTGTAHAAVGESFDATGFSPRLSSAGRAFSVGVGMRERAGRNMFVAERYSYARIPGGGGVIADHRAVVSVAYAF